MPIRPTIHGLLDAAIAVEAQVRDFYLSLCRAFDYIPGVASLFHSFMADQARNLSVLRGIRAETVDSTPDHPLVAEVLSLTPAILDLVSQTSISAIDNLDDAYELAREYEVAESRLIRVLLATGVVPPELRVSFRPPEIHARYSTIVRFGRQFGNRAWRRQMPALHRKDQGRLTS
jgi:hypothetical protein